MCPRVISAFDSHEWDLDLRNKVVSNSPLVASTRRTPLSVAFSCEVTHHRMRSRVHARMPACKPPLALTIRHQCGVCRSFWGFGDPGGPFELRRSAGALTVQPYMVRNRANLSAIHGPPRRGSLALARAQMPTTVRKAGRRTRNDTRRWGAAPRTLGTFNGPRPNRQKGTQTERSE